MQLKQRDIKPQEIEFKSIQNIDLLESVGIEYLFVGNTIPSQAQETTALFESAFKVKNEEKYKY